MCSLACSQNKGLSEYQRTASWLRTSSSTRWRQRGRGVTARAGGQGAILAPETASSSKMWAGSQLLTMSSWDPGWLTSTRRVTAQDQLPRGDPQHTWDGVLVVHPGKQAAKTREVIRCTTHLEQCTHQAPGHLSCSDLGRAQNTCPTKSMPLWSTWEPEPEQLRPAKCTQPKAHFGWCPCRAPWSLSSVDQESTCCLELGQTQCGPYTASTPHTHQWYFFAVFLPRHNTAEQVSLHKWSPSLPCVRVEIRHWRDLQTKKAKIKKREPLYKWLVQQIKTL